MNTACETVKDLIPLYIDGDCSKTTEKLVKEHIKKCRDCAKYLKMCRHSAEMAEKRTKKNKEDADFVIIPDDGYEIIARRIKKRVTAERIAFISAFVAAVVTAFVIFVVKGKKER